MKNLTLTTSQVFIPKCTTTNTTKSKNISVTHILNIDSQHVNVSLGDIELAFRCNYLVSKGGQNMTGWARGRVLVDQTAFFTKRLLIIDGLL